MCCSLLPMAKATIFISSIALIWHCCLANSASRYLHTKRVVNELKSRGWQKDSSPSSINIINARGFTAELYSIPSEDGSTLSMYHIINPYANQQLLNRYPVLVVHGLASDSSQMISHSEQQRARPPVVGKLSVEESDTALAFLLSNNNFDVYLMEMRGSNLNNHLVSVEYNPIEAAKYWNYSLDEQIQYDLPAAIDFVLEQTFQTKLHYIGISESTLFMFGLLAARPEYQSKLVSYVALAPIAYVGNITGMTVPLLGLTSLIPDSFNGNAVPQIVSDSFGLWFRQLCHNKLLVSSVCLLGSDAISGSSDSLASTEFYNSLSKSTSIKSIKHLLQMYLSKRFAMYDYGPVGNLRQYGSERAPDYNLLNVRLPSIILFRSDQDFLSDTFDQERLLRSLGIKPFMDRVLHFNHVDFVVGRTVVRDINFPAMKAMFDLLILQTMHEPSRPSSILRDPKKFLWRRPYQPTVALKPDGTSDLQIRSNFVGNLIEGLVDAIPNQLVNQEGVSNILQQPLSLMNSYGK